MGKTVYVRKPPASSDSGKASRFLRNYNGPYLVIQGVSKKVSIKNFYSELLSRKTAIKFQNVSVSLCFKNPSLSIIWANLGLSYQIYEKES